MPEGNMMLPAQRRAALVRAETTDEKARTIEVLFTTGARVRRRRYPEDFDEELVVTPEAMRTDRLNAGAPFLNAHDAYSLESVIGVVVEGSARVENGQGVATIRFSEREDVEPIFRDIAGGIIRSVSVGYRVHKYEIEKRDGEVELWRAVDWEPLEISAVPIGADPGARVRADAAESYPVAITRRDANAGTPATKKGNPIMPNGMTTPAPSPDDIRATERQRIAAIDDLARRHALGDEWRGRMIESGSELAAARSHALQTIADRDNETIGQTQISDATASALGGSRQNRVEGLSRSLLARMNPSRYSGLASEHPYAVAFRGRTMLDMIRENERLAGRGSAGLNRTQLLDQALRGYTAYGAQGTGDFSAALEGSARRLLLDAYQSAEPGARLLARPISFSDQRPRRSVRGSSFPELKKVLEHGEITHGTIKASGEEILNETYARIAGLTRKAIINDDVGLFTSLIQSAAEAALATEQNLIVAAIEANPDLSDTFPVFHANHGNLANPGGAPDEASLSAAVLAMRNQTGNNGERISLSPRFILVPAARETAARKAVASVQPASTSDANIFSNLTVIVDPRLTNVNAWYLVAGRGGEGTPEAEVGLARGYLDGEDGPLVDSRDGWETDGVEVRVRLNFGAGWEDYRSWYRNHGA